MNIAVMCRGQAPNGKEKCGDRERCKRFKSTPDANQDYREYYRAGVMCQHYVGLGGEWNESRTDDIGKNGNVGYE